MPELICCWRCRGMFPPSAYLSDAGRASGKKASCTDCLANARAVKGVAPVYDEAAMIANWREAAASTACPEARMRLLRLANQLQNIVWRRGVFAPEKPRMTRVKFALPVADV